MWSEQPAHLMFHSLGRAALLTASFSKETGSDQMEAHSPSGLVARLCPLSSPFWSPSSQACAHWRLLPHLAHFPASCSASLKIQISLKLTDRHTHIPWPSKEGLCDTRSVQHQALLAGQAQSPGQS